MTLYITASGIEIDIANPRVNQINLNDIAHHLTNDCRYGRTLPLVKFYSVAEHSLNLFWHCRENDLSIDAQRCALMHDASEAYLGDIHVAIKQYLPDYIALEKKYSDIIHKKYKISKNKKIAKLIKELDTRIVLDESYYLFGEKRYKRYLTQMKGYAPLNLTIFRLPKYIVKDEFLNCCALVGIHD